MGRNLDAALQIADRAGTELRSLGQFFLRQPGCEPVMLEKSTKR